MTVAPGQRQREFALAREKAQFARVAAVERLVRRGEFVVDRRQSGLQHEQ